MSLPQHIVLTKANIEALGNWSDICDDGEASVTELKTIITNFLRDQFQIEMGDPLIGIERVPMNPELELKEYGLEIHDDSETYYRMDINVEGRLMSLFRCAKLNSQDIRDNHNQLKPYPMAINEATQVEFDAEGFWLKTAEDRQKLTVIHVARDNNDSHGPFGLGEEGHIHETKWRVHLPLPKITTGVPDQHVFMAGRWAWGLNLSLALLDIPKAKIYAFDSYNFDYPEGLAARVIDEGQEVEYYLDNDSIDRTCLYWNDQHQKEYTIWHSYPNSQWRKFGVQKELEHLLAGRAFIKAQPKLMTLDEHYANYWNNATEAYNAKDYAGARDQFVKILACPYSDYLKPPGFMFEGRRNSHTYYNLACLHNLMGEPDPALDYLEKATRVGYKDYRHMRKDPDLDGLRDNPQYLQLIKEMGDTGEDAPDQGDTEEDAPDQSDTEEDPDKMDKEGLGDETLPSDTE